MTKTKHDLAAIQPIAQEVRDLLKPFTSWVEIAGSVRRGKAKVSDVELVALKTNRLWNALDRFVMDGTFTRWQDRRGLERWNGGKYRAFVYRGIHVDIFACDKWNRGYQFWLRTGPGDANQFMVTKIKYGAPFSIESGYLYDKKGNKLYVPNEAAWWSLLNMLPIEPGKRTETAYHRVFERGHIWKPPAHTLTIRTGQIATCKHAPDFLDITVKSASDPAGQALAPTWDMLNAYKAGTISWDTYREQYLALLRQRYAENPALFNSLLRRDSITLGCYCHDNKPCHRLIAVYVLSKLASANGTNLIYTGEYERDSTIAQPALF